MFPLLLHSPPLFSARAETTQTNKQTNKQALVQLAAPPPLNQSQPILVVK